ncbi:hypothetical protein [Odoribacter lunatus]|uniref:hypothetical protein n=1 Tax=Odoribacter lunatus TaxID=2941335 RepID=UPI00203C8101|nr:hypothetical protein [Odoribacter lunatus]
MPRIVIRFRTEVQLHAFARFYSGTPGIWGHRHPNYGGQVGKDCSLGSGIYKWVYLDSEYVRDFEQLGRDVMMFGGEIEPY